MQLRYWLSALLASLCAAVLPACDVVNLPEIRPGITAQSEVRQRLGEPGFIHTDPDGSTTWEYSRQPAGVDCYMITFDDKAVVSRMEQVLTGENYARVRPGMTPVEIRRLLGQPGSKTPFANLGEEIWEWRIRGDMPLDETYFMVHFDLGDGLVRKTSQRVQPKN